MAENKNESIAGSDFFRADLPPWLNYFTQNWLNKQPSKGLNYLEGWSGDSPRTIAYNVPMAFLSNMKPTVNWENPNETSYGPAWHGYSKTPGGTWLKEPWHPTHWREDYSVLENQLAQIKKIGTQ